MDLSMFYCHRLLELSQTCDCVGLQVGVSSGSLQILGRYRNGKLRASQDSVHSRVSCRLASLLAGRSPGQPAGWLAGWLAGWIAGSLFD